MRKLILLTLVTFLLAGCGSSSGAKPTTTPAALGDFPVGNFTNQGWGWEFKPDGSYTLQGQYANESGTLTVTGNQITIHGNACGDIIGTYNWTYDGMTLTFEGVNDECVDRAGTVVNGKWIKRP